MKTFEVEYRRTSYITITVEADSKEEADEKAWVEIEHDRADINDACWELESIEEVQPEGASK
jgi:hypothetical protein